MIVFTPSLHEYSIQRQVQREKAKLAILEANLDAVTASADDSAVSIDSSNKSIVKGMNILI
jgi:hypothetical protein